MIGNLVKGRGARGLMDYLLSPFDQKGGPRPRVNIVGGTFAGRDAREIAAEFGALHRLRPKVGVYLLHESLRLPDGDPEPDEATWAAIAESWVKSMGIDDFVSVAHGDGHIHIAASRIKRDGSVVSDRQDYRRSEAAIRKIEADFKLTIVASSHLLNPEAAVDHHRAPTRGQMIYNELSGKLPPSMAVAALIDQIIEDGATVTELVLKLEAAGIQVHPNIASTGRVSGLAYEVDEIRLTSKAMGRGFTWANLQERGLSYEPDRDDEELRAAKSRRQLETSERVGIDGTDRASVGGDQDLQSIRQRHGAGDTNGQGASGRDGEGKRTSEGINSTVGDPDIISNSVAVGRDDDLDHLVHLAAAELDSPDRGSSAFAVDGPAGAAGDPRLAQLADYLARDLARCGEQVGRFVQAVGADSYQIMTRTPDVEGGAVRRQIWSPEQALDPKNVKWLRSQNAAGGGIYIRAMDRRITLLDDLKLSTIDEMALRGYQAAASIETSPNNFQSWIRLVPADAPEPSLAVATQASRLLTKSFGGDPGAVGSERFGRLPGFTNRKPSHEHNGFSPWVTIKSAVYGVASAGHALISKIGQALHAGDQRKAKHVKQLAAVASEVADRGETIPLSAAENLFIRGLALSSLQPGLSQSEIDFRACGLALKHGSTVKQVEAALLKHSPRIEERHPHTDNYIERTVRRASVSDYALNRPVDADTEGPGL